MVDGEWMCTCLEVKFGYSEASLHRLGPSLDCDLITACDVAMK